MTGILVGIYKANMATRPDAFTPFFTFLVLGREGTVPIIESLRDRLRAILTTREAKKEIARRNQDEQNAHGERESRMFGTLVQSEQTDTDSIQCKLARIEVVRSEARADLSVNEGKRTSPAKPTWQERMIALPTENDDYDTREFEKNCRDLVFRHFRLPPSGHPTRRGT
jgi:hypothetical protein